MKVYFIILVFIMIHFTGKAQWTTVDVDNSPEITLFQHSGSSTPVPFNIRKTGYVGSSISYGLLHLDMGHSTIGGGSNIHFRLKDSSGNFKEYGGLGAFIINNASGNIDGGLTFYTTMNGATRQRRMTILNNGNLGVGKVNPSRKLNVVSTLWDNTHGAGVIFENNNLVGAGLTLKPTASLISNGNNGWAIYAGGPSSAVGDGNLGFWAHGTNEVRMSINRNGNVGIGTVETGSHKLAVEGTIGAREIKVEASGWSDFVFENDYKLKDLEEVESFIEENKHLPDVPSEKEVLENGIQLGEMDAKLLQKIEELTLYTIQQEKEIKALKSLNKKFIELQLRLEKLELKD